MPTPDTDYNLPELLGTYRKDGSLIREKARVLVEDWLDRIYPRMQDPETPTSTLLAIGESLIRLGDLAPKAGAASTTPGSGFSITINIPQQNGESITITGRQAETAEPAPMLDITDFNPLPPKPQWIPVPDFNLNAELSGGVVPPGAVGTGLGQVPPARVDGVTGVAHSPTQAGAFAQTRL